MLQPDICPHLLSQAFFERMKVIAEVDRALGAQLKCWLHVTVDLPRYATSRTGSDIMRVMALGRMRPWWRAKIAAWRQG
jgi:hypothetical protein